MLNFLFFIQTQVTSISQAVHLDRLKIYPSAYFPKHPSEAAIFKNTYEITTNSKQNNKFHEMQAQLLHHE